MNAKVPVPGARPEPPVTTPRNLPSAAVRALEEAAARRVARKPAEPRELNGRGGLDPARYGDWEVNGRAIDF